MLIMEPWRPCPSNSSSRVSWSIANLRYGVSSTPGVGGDMFISLSSNSRWASRIGAPTLRRVGDCLAGAGLAGKVISLSMTGCCILGVDIFEGGVSYCDRSLGFFLLEASEA